MALPCRPLRFFLDPGASKTIIASVRDPGGHPASGPSRGGQ